MVSIPPPLCPWNLVEPIFLCVYYHLILSESAGVLHMRDASRAVRENDLFLWVSNTIPIYTHTRYTAPNANPIQSHILTPHVHTLTNNEYKQDAYTYSPKSHP